MLVTPSARLKRSAIPSPPLPMASPGFLPFVTVVLHLILTTEAVTDTGDAAAMHVLAKSIGADSSLNWSPTSDPCTQWPKVQCDGGKVTAIQIGNIHNLSGSLPPEVGNLTALQRLETQFVGLGGPLPSLKGLANLNVLLLHDNAFSAVPPDFFTGLSGLTVVSLDHNPFSPWPIPPSLKDCFALTNFSANNASVVGGVPEFFATSFPSIYHLALAFNDLGGEIPQSFANSGLKSLWLNGNNLTGGVGVIANMTDLTVVYLQSNSLTGPLPDFSRMNSLRLLNLRDNKITGVVPKSLTGLKSLQNVVLTNNLLQGPMPVFDKGVQLDLNPDSERFCHDSSEECDPRVDVLLSVVSSFGYPVRFADNWKNNDPCVGWVGISCDLSGNIISVNFQKMNLSGVISPDFEKLGALQKLILSNNNLTGIIPPGLINLKKLQVLDVSNNNLSGDVPSFNNVAVNTNGNPSIGTYIGVPPGASVPSSPPDGGGGSPSNGSGGGGNVGVIVGCIIAGIVVIGIVGLLGFCYWKRREVKFGKTPMPNMMIHPRFSGSDVEMLNRSAGWNRSGSTSQTWSGPSSLQVAEPISLVYSSQVLRVVTDNFSEDNILGRGGFGTVYKGELQDGTMIAVKRMESAAMGSKGLSEFKSEISVLTKVRHRHLVSLLGYCLEENERILVYEYMPQGTLSDHLFGWAKAGLKPLEWKMRLSIALDVARGVEYLHSLMNQTFIHRDLKPSNILLGNDMRAKVADFGLVRLAPEGKQCSVETRIAGTFGYLAPEYAVTGRVTTKADIFSFGVILMELITGRTALDDSRPEDSTHLVTWFRRMQLNNNFITAIDPAIDLSDKEISDSVNIVSELAGHCCVRDPHQRPDMSYAVNTLSSLVEKWKPNSQNLDDAYGIGLGATLSQALGDWQEFGSQMGNNGYSAQFGDSMQSIPGCGPAFDVSTSNTQDSIPPNPVNIDSQQAR